MNAPICRDHEIKGCVYCSPLPVVYLIKIYDVGGHKPIRVEAHLLEDEALAVIEGLTTTEWVSLERIKISKQTV